MTEREFNERAEQAMTRIQDALDASGADLDWEMSGGSVLEISLENGSKIIVNRQPAAHELWVAAKSGGFHYRWRDDAWRDTRDGTELFEALGRLLTGQGGVSVDFG